MQLDPKARKGCAGLAAALFIAVAGSSRLAAQNAPKQALVETSVGVFVIDLAAHKVVKSVKVGPRPRSIGMVNWRPARKPAIRSSSFRN